MANLMMLVIYSWTFYFVLLGDQPEWNAASMMTRLGDKLVFLVHQGQHCVSRCMEHSSSSSFFTAALFSAECFPILPQIMACLAYVLAMWNFHKIWPRVLWLTMVVMLSIGQRLPLGELWGTAPTIDGFDPAFAQLHEPTLIMIQGKNLKRDSTIGWISYYGCASMSERLGDCALMYEQTFDAGVVTSVFDLADEYIPCYRESTFETPVCFEQLRLRVREKHSIPGWSAKIQRGDFDDNDNGVIVDDEEFEVNARRGGIHQRASM